MANEMNRRQMLGTTSAVLGGVVAGVTGNVFAQEKPAAAKAAAPAVSGGPNLNPPVVTLKGGKLRGPTRAGRCRSSGSATPKRSASGSPSR
jgi:hypothetical protein